MRRPRRAALLLAGATVLAAACSFNFDTVVQPHVLLRMPEGGRINSYNLEEQLRMGYVPELISYFRSPSATSVDSTRTSFLLGHALLQSGDFAAACARLERAHTQQVRLSDRAETSWLISQAKYWLGDFKSAATWAGTARDEGQGVPKGWITFLQSAAEKRPYGGAEPGQRFKIGIGFGHPDLPRVLVRVNERPPGELIIDSGASLSLLSESAAKRLGVDYVEDATAGAFGLHRVEMTMHFGWAKSVQIGALTVTNVPFGILPDEALLFQTASTAGFKFDGVLGVHFMKEFDWRLEYRQRQIAAVKIDGAQPRGSKDQNIFFRRLKPMVRVSFNQEGWFLFLLDTGSEPTMVTRTGLHKTSTRELEGSYPMTIEGIGNSRVTWAKMSDATVGCDRFMVKFKDLVVKEESEGIEDGVVGSSFLGNFDAELRFSTMTLRLERTVERLMREAETSEAAAGGM